MNKMSEGELAYLAGIFDGEGWYVSDGKANCSVCVAMTDFDVIEQIHTMTGIGTLSLRPAKGSKQAQLTWAVRNMEGVEEVIKAMLPYLSERRTADGLEVLQDIQTRRERAEWRTKYFICGHPKEESNTYHTKQGKTNCRECILERSRQKAKKRSKE